jgi:cytochrome P450
MFWHDKLEAWVTASYYVCEHALSDWRAFASDYRRVGESAPSALLSVQTLDPPVHTSLSRLLADAIKNLDVQHFAATVRSGARGRLREMAARGGGDLIADLTLPLAIESTLDFLGVQDVHGGRLVQLSAAVIASMNAGLRPETEKPGVDAREELNSEIASWFESPRSKGVIAYTAIHAGLRGVERSMLRNSIRVLLLAGINSTQRMLGLAARAMMGDASAAQRLRTTNIPLRQVVRELVRFDNPFQAQGRRCVGESELDGVRLHHGDTIVLLLGGANHDPQRFSDPHRLILDREPNRHLGFGRGVHSCVGTPIALVSLREFLVAAWRESVLLNQAGEEIYDPNPTLRGLTSLPVRITVRT